MHPFLGNGGAKSPVFFVFGHVHRKNRALLLLPTSNGPARVSGTLPSRRHKRSRSSSSLMNVRPPEFGALQFAERPAKRGRPDSAGDGCWDPIPIPAGHVWGQTFFTEQSRGCDFGGSPQTPKQEQPAPVNPNATAAPLDHVAPLQDAGVPRYSPAAHPEIRLQGPLNATICSGCPKIARVRHAWDTRPSDVFSDHQYTMVGALEKRDQQGRVYL